MANVADHLERFCGRMIGGWSGDPNGAAWPFQIAVFAGGPFDGALTLCTLGLSNYPLRSPNTGKVIRHELLMLTRRAIGPKNLPSILQSVAMEAIDSDAALLQGDVIGPRGSLMDGSDLAALYVTIPVCFPDEFHSCPVSFDEPVVLVWLVPISSAEAAFVGDQGWNAFEEQLAALDPDLWDFDRPSIIPG